MKKGFVVIAAILLVSIGASQVLACSWDGYGYNHDPMMGSGYGYGRGNYQQFMNETAALRQELSAKSGEYDALMAQSNPDPDRAARVSQEIARLREDLRMRAQNYGVNGQDYYGSSARNAGWNCWW